MKPFSEILAGSPANITGRQVQTARVMAGLTQVALAEGAGMSARTLQAIERFGNRSVDTPERNMVMIQKVLWEKGAVRFTAKGVQRERVS